MRQEVRRLPSVLPASERHDLESKRQRLATRIKNFHTKLYRFLGVEQVSSRQGRPDDLPADGYISDELRDNDERRPTVITEIENSALVFPSNISGSISQHLKDLQGQET